jgi:LPS export ABC transporter protein LptC
LRLQIEGRELRHLPVSDRIEIDNPTVRAFAPDGREMVGTARQLVSDARGTDVVLSGGARVIGTTAQGLPAEIEGEALRVHPREDRVRSDLPVRLRIGKDTVEAAGVDYNQRSGQVEFSGPVRAELAPRAPVAKTAPKPKSPPPSRAKRNPR